MSKLSNVVNDEVVKKTVFDKLVAKVNAIYTRGFVLKTKCYTEKSNLKMKISYADKKIPDTSSLVKKTDYNAKITDITDLVFLVWIFHYCSNINI